jgi:hypothetical protein
MGALSSAPTRYREVVLTASNLKSETRAIILLRIALLLDLRDHGDICRAVDRDGEKRCS